MAAGTRFRRIKVGGDFIVSIFQGDHQINVDEIVKKVNRIATEHLVSTQLVESLLVPHWFPVDVLWHRNATGSPKEQRENRHHKTGSRRRPSLNPPTRVDLQRSIAEIIRRSEQVPIVVVAGPSGAGKTFTMLHYVRSAIEISEDQAKIFVALSEWRSDSFEEWIGALLHRSWRLSEIELHALIEAGRLQVILDGFDEIVHQRLSLDQALNEVTTYSLNRRMPVIITVRDAQARPIAGVDVIELLPVTDEVATNIVSRFGSGLSIDDIHPEIRSNAFLLSLACRLNSDELIGAGLMTEGQIWDATINRALLNSDIESHARRHLEFVAKAIVANRCPARIGEREISAGWMPTLNQYRRVMRAMQRFEAAVVFTLGFTVLWAVGVPAASAALFVCLVEVLIATTAQPDMLGGATPPGESEEGRGWAVTIRLAAYVSMSALLWKTVGPWPGIVVPTAALILAKPVARLRLEQPMLATALENEPHERPSVNDEPSSSVADALPGAGAQLTEGMEYILSNLGVEAPNPEPRPPSSRLRTLGRWAGILGKSAIVPLLVVVAAQSSFGLSATSMTWFATALVCLVVALQLSFTIGNGRVNINVRKDASTRSITACALLFAVPTSLLSGYVIIDSTRIDVGVRELDLVLSVSLAVVGFLLLLGVSRGVFRTLGRGRVRSVRRSRLRALVVSVGFTAAMYVSSQRWQSILFIPAVAIALASSRLYSYILCRAATRNDSLPRPLGRFLRELGSTGLIVPTEQSFRFLHPRLARHLASADWSADASKS